MFKLADTSLILINPSPSNVNTTSVIMIINLICCLLHLLVGYLQGKKNGGEKLRLKICIRENTLYALISVLVVEYQGWWVLKSKIFGPDSTCLKGEKKNNPLMNDSLSKIVHDFRK